MKVAGAWVGLGIGDVSEEVRRLKAHMRRKFSYCAGLHDTTLFDQQMVDAVVEMQRRYNAAGTLKAGSYTPGIVNVETKIVCGFIPRPVVDNRPVLFTVCGTGVPWWVGPDADTARAVEDRYLWQPIGYPARAVPMGPSIAAGKDELENQINRHRPRIERCGMVLLGYSQGAIVATELFAEQIRPIGGRLRWSYSRIRKAVMWGNPCRERGQVSPDAGARPAGPGSQGVAPTRLADTPPWWVEYAHAGDLYADCPTDESGENRAAIWAIIRDGSIAKGPDSLLRQILELGGAMDGSAVAEMTGLAKAMLDALVFFGAGTRPHINYSTAEAVAYLRAA